MTGSPKFFVPVRPAVIGPPLDIGEELTANILLVVTEGWTRAREEVRRLERRIEVPITEKLRRAMRSVLDEDHFPWAQDVRVLAGMESTSRDELPEPDGRTDMSVMFVHILVEHRFHEPQAVIECKRIDPSKTLIDGYVDEGIDRFVTGKYSSSHARAFMIGYVIGGSDLECVERVNTRLRLDGREGEILSNSSGTSFVGTWVSRHPRAVLGHIGIFHALVECCFSD